MNNISITPSDVIEYLYCPRFIYFMHCLDIPQYEDKNYKVVKGRSEHIEKMLINQEYLRKKIGVVRKEINIFLGSKKHCFHGIVDEILFLDDNTAAPFDYKYAVYNEKMFKTYITQSYMYALLIKEAYEVECKKGYICYIRSSNLLKEIEYTAAGFEKIKNIISDIIEIISSGVFPQHKANQAKCTDCTYSNICVK